MLDKIAALIVAKLIEKLTPILVEMMTKLGKELLEKIVALLPVLLAAFGKQLADKMPDLNLPDLPDVPQLAENIAKTASDMLPNGVDIPIVSDLGKSVLGIDLTELLGMKT